MSECVWSCVLWGKNTNIYLSVSVCLSSQLPADLNKMHLTDHAHQQVMHVPPSQSGCSIASDSGSSSLSDIYQVGAHKIHFKLNGDSVFCQHSLSVILNTSLIIMHRLCILVVLLPPLLPAAYGRSRTGNEPNLSSCLYTCAASIETAAKKIIQHDQAPNNHFQSVENLDRRTSEIMSESEIKLQKFNSQTFKGAGYVLEMYI